MCIKYPINDDRNVNYHIYIAISHPIFKNDWIAIYKKEIPINQIKKVVIEFS